VVFIDNILIYSKDRNEHITHLGMVLQTLGEHQLHSKYKKREFWLEEVVFLGHVLSKERIKANLKQVKAIKEFLRLTNVTKEKKFLFSRVLSSSGKICQRSTSQTNLLKKATS